MIKKTKDNLGEEQEKPKKVSPEEYEKKVIELADKGLSAEKIGEELRKNNIHPKEYGKKISRVLKEKHKNIELENTEIKLKKIEEHLKKNPQDKRAKRERSRIFSKVRKIKKYLKLI